MTTSSSAGVPGLDCATAFRKMAQDCVAGVKAHHGSACAGDAEAVHRIRVAITRLRAAVSFFAPIAVDAEWLRLKREIAWLNVSLGAGRVGPAGVGDGGCWLGPGIDRGESEEQVLLVADVLIHAGARLVASAAAAR